MDAGVPIKKPVAGIAMGLITDGKGKFVTLSDILGLEDHLGDMDFKVAGTSDGVTAIQMDVKVKGVTTQILKGALDQAKRGRLHILKIMTDVISEPRQKLSQYAPRIISFTIDPEKIGTVIGPGGKVIRQIQAETGVEISIDDDGTVSITGVEAEGVDKARTWVESITAEAEVGKIYKGKVARIQPFGAFVEILPGKDGLVHISQLVGTDLNTLKVGDIIDVKLYEIDSVGRLNLTMNLTGDVVVDRPERRPGGDRGGNRGGDRGGFSRGGGSRFTRFNDHR
jgi:polyribonucleotide nucleotidyltransferase